MARRAPVQERSIASMNRMLDAGEQLFFEGGAPALTLESVIERAETSTGSFYARFGDMRGFLDALHERVLGLLAAEFAPVFARAAAEKDLDTALRTLLSQSFAIIHRHRVQTYFFAVGNSHDPKWRSMGTQFALNMSDAVAGIMRGFLPKPVNAASKRRIDMAVRTVIAASFQQIMFDQEEISRLSMTQRAVASEIATMVSGYLLAPTAK